MNDFCLHLRFERLTMIEKLWNAQKIQTSLTFETLLLISFQFRTNKLLFKKKICSRLKLSETTLASQLKSSIAGYQMYEVSSGENVSTLSCGGNDFDRWQHDKNHSK